MTILPLLEGNYARAAQTNEEGLFTETIRYEGHEGVLMEAYIARPEKMQRYAAVMVIHENRGLNPHIADVARRAAKAGYLAIAPNALSPLGGTPVNEDEARQLFTKLDAAASQKNFIRAFPYLDTRADYNGKSGCVGFCWGGAMANHLAVNVPTLKATVAYYGRQPETADVEKIRAAVQLHYASLDERVNAGIPAYEEALKKHGITYELHMYEGANHAFHNDTAPTRYHEPSAKLSWQRTIDFFNRHLA
jgi:carboxymethylenebutenolidase